MFQQMLQTMVTKQCILPAEGLLLNKIPYTGEEVLNVIWTTRLVLLMLSPHLDDRAVALSQLPWTIFLCVFQTIMHLYLNDSFLLLTENITELLSPSRKHNFLEMNVIPTDHLVTFLVFP